MGVDAMIKVYRVLLLGLLSVLLLITPPALADEDGDGSITVTGDLMQWHRVTLTIAGPFAREADTEPNPFTDYNFSVTFTHELSGLSYTVPGYFAADGNAAQTSATEGTQWRAHLSPDLPGRWTYTVSMLRGTNIALTLPEEQRRSDHERLRPYHGTTGSFDVAPTNATGRDLRAHGRLQYVGQRYLQFAGSGEYFLKAGADSPETLLAYADFDNTVAPRNNAPLKTYQAHVRDWQPGDPTWQGTRGRGLIGAINYLSSTGCNAFSFLTYNAGGDGDNVWPFVDRDDPMHYDCSKLDQWQIVFDHATTRGMYLHFKLQETENDDNRGGRNNNADVPAALDGGDLGLERQLYLRELVARFGHELALNWNLGEENTQSTQQQRDMAAYLHAIDPYHHHIVVHTYPNQQDRVYTPLLGDGSVLTGASLQSSDVHDCHWQTLQWVERSAQRGRPWVVAFDEPGDATFGTPPDPEYPGVARVNNVSVTVDDVRRYALWGTLMAGGSGVELYFGYRLPQNDLNCEDWRSRAQTWRWCDIALSFFRDNAVPFWEMAGRDDLIGADVRENAGYCLAKPGQVYLVYLPLPRESIAIDLTGQRGSYDVSWFNPRAGGALIPGGQVRGGGIVMIPGMPDSEAGDDWLVMLRVH